ncbi:hypothetical protein J5N97_004366 [Dioscorea zingiberensis]|uniref:Maturase n=1 Tax=Dioscorea zingiberensis TaxID=325984 RepID=A0A9D5HQW7_9LILI|nr:hypothetical protein J5N97_004366 [Dioscorea zingiberensis]
MDSSWKRNSNNVGRSYIVLYGIWRSWILPSRRRHSPPHLRFPPSRSASPSSPAPLPSSGAPPPTFYSAPRRSLHSPYLPPQALDDLLSSAPPPFQDRVVQELLLLILEPVFEPKFSSKSHAFRPGRNAHTLLRTIRSHFAGYVWFLKADLRHVTGNLSPDVFSGCLEKVVKDKKVLGLIKSALKTPVRVGTREADKVFDKLTKKRMKRKVLRMSRKKKILKENEPKPDPYWLRTFFDFAPEEAANVLSYAHCGILSPLLANVCLNELDHWLEEKIDRYFCPSKLDSIWRESSDDGCHNPAWPEFVPSSGNEKTRRMDFVRYGSHVLIGIRGPREDAVEIRKEIMDFCENKFGIRLENSKIEIEHITRGIEFLDHVICRRVIHPTQGIHSNRREDCE